MPARDHKNHAAVSAVRAASYHDHHLFSRSVEGAGAVGLERRSFAQRQNSEMGFVHMALVVFAPLLVTILVLLAVVLSSIYQITAADRVCKKEAMRTQHELSLLLKSLVGLNFSARMLRNKKWKAEAQLAAALASGNPATIAAASAFVKSVLIEQRALAVRQQRLLEMATFERQISQPRLFSQSAQAGLQQLRVLNGSSNLGVLPQPPFSLTPDYVAPENFKERQSQTFRYQLNLFDRAPPFIQQYLKHPLLREILVPVPASCSATLATQEENWKPRLKKVNP
jgi:hypothetical protein